MKVEAVKTLLFVFGRLGNHLTNEKAKELFVACYENGVDAPDWLTKKIIEILKKQVNNYKEDRPFNPHLEVQELHQEATKIHFMWDVDALRAKEKELSQEDAVERVNYEFDAREYRRIKKRYGDLPPEPLF